MPKQYRAGYEDILQNITIDCGDIGYLTIDESLVYEGMPHRGYRAKYGRALHTEAGRYPYSPIITGEALETGQRALTLCWIEMCRYCLQTISTTAAPSGT